MFDNLLLNWFIYKLPIIILSVAYCHFTIKRMASFRKLMAEPNVMGTDLLGISIIIPFFNEAKYLPKLINSLQKINYSGHEIIFVNDRSSDKGEELITENENLKLLNNTKETGKKGALHTGILAAQHPYIITIDADCIVDPNILNAYAAQFTTGADMVLGLVCFKPQPGMASHYAMLENSSLVAWALANANDGKPNMANGANLGFNKQKYMDANGYEGHMHISSGDDEFLLQSFVNMGARIKVAKNAFVLTSTINNWQAFLEQRCRWASKTKKYTAKKQWVYHLSQWAFMLWLLAIIYSLTSLNIPFLIMSLGLKIYVDLSWFKLIAPHFHLPLNRFKITFISLLQLIVLPLTYIVSLFWHGSWKGRKIN
jgi:glycosyltransferase involved in cell wall biosynthesis